MTALRYRLTHVFVLPINKSLTHCAARFVTAALIFIARDVSRRLSEFIFGIFYVHCGFAIEFVLME